MQLEQDRKSLEAERKAIADARAKEQFNRDAAAHEQNFTRNFKQALTNTKMNATPWAMRRMATLALEAGERGRDGPGRVPRRGRRICEGP